MKLHTRRPSQPVSERPVDAEQAKTLDNALKKLFKTDVEPEELLVEYTRREFHSTSNNSVSAS